MVYQYRVHKKVKFSREDRINAGADPVREKINEVITWIFVIIMVICAIYLIIVVPVVISLELGEWRFFAVWVGGFSLYAVLFMPLFMRAPERNATLTLNETEAHFEKDPVRGKFCYKYTVSYDRVSKVYHTDICPVELAPMVKNSNNQNFNRELWHFYNGSYIVAEDCNDNLLFGAVYNEEMWNVLKKYCKNATFYTKEEYLAYIEKKRELDRKHDEYSKKYDGYVN